MHVERRPADPAAVEDEQIAMTGAKLFTEYLRRVREGGAQSTLAPGRFLLPGDLEGSPLLTFFPMPLASDERPPRASLAAMMMRRFESYKSTVVKPFFNEHFARLDRQIVLVDVLGALNRGADAVGDLERAMTAILKAFRPGANSWLSLLIGGFAAGMAGAAEVAGPIGQLQRSISTGYGYAAIIVAYLGGLHPLGIVASAFLMAALYIGGDNAMVSADLPVAAVRVFQGSLLVCYLAAITFVRYRLVRTGAAPA